MFSRTWLAVLAGSVALWGMNQLGGGVPLPDAGAGGLSPAAAGRGGPGTGGVPRRGRGARMRRRLRGRPCGTLGRSSGGYRERCRPVLGGEAFDAFALRLRRAVAGGGSPRSWIREARLAVELTAGPQAGALDPDLVWAAALGRAASDARAFDAELVAWFDARAPSGGDAAVVVPAGAAGR